MEPLSIALWLGLCESLTLTVGAWVLYAWLDHVQPGSKPGFATTATAVGYAPGCSWERRWWYSDCPTSPTRTSPPR